MAVEIEALKAISLPPGFGFHPTDVELISHYLKRKNLGLEIDFEVIPVVDIYKCEPWDLPAYCSISTRDSKWHFFTSCHRKYPNGLRSNRATEAGYWKSTGKDRNIKFNNQIIGSKKTLVFHKGRPPYGKRTDWIMHEYHMAGKEGQTSSGVKNTFVLCRVSKRDSIEVKAEYDSRQSNEIESNPQLKYPNATVVQEKSSHSENLKDLDACFEELLDPTSCKSSDSSFMSHRTSAELKSEPQSSQADIGALTPKDDDPLDYGFLPEEIFAILRDDFASMPQITDLLGVDNCSSPFSNDQVSSHSEDLKEQACNQREDCEFTGIQIRKRRKGPASESSHHRFKLQVQTAKLEMRTNKSASQTISFIHKDHIISSYCSSPEHFGIYSSLMGFSLLLLYNWHELLVLGSLRDGDCRFVHLLLHP
ncbi:NAC domain-containing protein 74 [Apostasia shenzhenica]|uniref:NAC domain-containing protein 74 n=1 Tax=Apostasia shenzhenica TaxID=1088818 RepID=A0A2I0B7X7_9ASPA|nr:NAC domain-containing protein 74 [Apostasia shenzhenica]